MIKLNFKLVFRYITVVVLVFLMLGMNEGLFYDGNGAVQKTASGDASIDDKDLGETAIIDASGDNMGIEPESAELVVSLAGKASPKTPNKTTPKTSSAKQPVVIIDAGHGGYDAGAIGKKGTKEKDVTLSVALKVGEILKNKGVNVIYTRTSDKVAWQKNEKADLQYRTNLSNNSKADLFISIHTNSSIIRSVKGMETYYAPGSSNSKALASAIQNKLVSSLKFPNRGIKSERFYVLRNTKVPAVLVELGFISNSSEEDILKSSKYQSSYAEAVAGGILSYLKK